MKNKKLVKSIAVKVMAAVLALLMIASVVFMLLSFMETGHTH